MTGSKLRILALLCTSIFSIETERIYCAITENIPLRIVFEELARIAGYNVVLNFAPSIKGGYISLNGSLDEVVTALCGDKLHYALNANVMQITDNLPYAIYKIEISPDNDNLWDEIESTIKQIVGNKGKYTINSNAGNVIIFASTFQHQQIESYLQQVSITAKRQAWIHVTIITVELNNEKSDGISIDGLWRILSQYNNLKVGFKNGELTFGTAEENTADSLSMICKILEKHGTVHTTSGITLSVAHNHPGEMHVRNGHVYFSVSKERAKMSADDYYGMDEQQILGINSENDRPSPKKLSNKGKKAKFKQKIGAMNYEMNDYLEHKMNAPEYNCTEKYITTGTSLYIKPYITDTDAILNIMFELSSVSGLKSNPSILLKAHEANANNNAIMSASAVPVIDKQCIKTIVNLSVGQSVLLGGLQSTSRIKIHSGIQVLSRLWFIGRLFGSTETKRKKEQVYIYLRLMPDCDLPKIYKPQPIKKAKIKQIKKSKVRRNIKRIKHS